MGLRDAFCDAVRNEFEPEPGYVVILLTCLPEQKFYVMTSAMDCWERYAHGVFNPGFIRGSTVSGLAMALQRHPLRSDWTVGVIAFCNNSHEAGDLRRAYVAHYGKDRCYNVRLPRPKRHDEQACEAVSRGKRGKPTCKTMRDDEVLKALRLRNEGFTAREIALELGHGANAIFNHLSEFGMNGRLPYEQTQRFKRKHGGQL